MKNKSRLSTRELVTAAVFSALTIVLSQIAIPMPSGVPVTLQTFAIALCGYTLGARLGLASIFTYILLGAAGVPVFSHFTGGFGILIGITGGFIFGFIPMTLLCGLAVRYKMFASVLMGFSGLFICHLFGVIQFSLIASSTFWSSFLLVSLPYLLKDLISVVCAYYISIALRRAIPAIRGKRNA